MKRPLIVIISMAFIAFSIVFFAFREDVPPPDTIFINDAVMTIMHMDDANEAVSVLSEQLLLAFGDMDQERASRDTNLQMILFLIIGAFVVLVMLIYLYYEKSIVGPFKKLQVFARQVAAGNLDMPLKMDKNNLFGAFTESFDLMREELKRARENEMLANQSKKELVASLSHDVKTPIASIKAVTELMLVSSTEKKEQRQLEIINAKAEQINLLITNMFYATLEELRALSVNIAEIPSTDIPKLLINADYEERLQEAKIPSCLVFADPIRLQQVFDNIIGNSYKYAKTDIKINAAFEAQNLVIEVMDFGEGVLEEELPLILNKFYRGKNSVHKSGYGLGLYISKYLLEQMDGGLHCENHPNGFTARIILRLVGT